MSEYSENTPTIIGSLEVIKAQLEGYTAARETIDRLDGKPPKCHVLLGIIIQLENSIDEIKSWRDHASKLG